MNELKNCPFHNCLTCGCYDCVDIPDKQWNTRPIEDALQARIDELEKETEHWHGHYQAKCELADALMMQLNELERQIRKQSNWMEKFWRGIISSDTTPLPEPPKESE